MNGVRCFLISVSLLILVGFPSSASPQSNQIIRKPNPLGGGPPPPAPPAHNHIGSSSQALGGTEGTIWPTDEIAVCWENPTTADQLGRTQVQQQIAATWEANSLLKFKGWGKCANNDKGIRIQLGNYHPHTEGVGTQLDGKHAGMKLNFTWSGCGGDTIGCVRWVATHEFGHALGFDHEQNRADAPLWCREQSQGPSPNIFMTPFDLQSIMNYCNPQWNNNGNLSPDDIAGLQFWYGPSQSSGNPWLPDCRVDVVLYQDKNFGGKSLRVSGSMDELSSVDFNDRTSSVCVPAGLTLRAFTDKGFTGKEVDFPGPTLVRALNAENDQISSLQLIDAKSGAILFDAPPVCQNNIVVFEDSFFRNRGLVLTSNLDNLSNIAFNFKDGGFVDSSSHSPKVNDRISSLCVPSGHTVTLFQNRNFGGKRIDFVGPFFRTNLSTMGWNDAASSIQVK